MLRIVGEFGRSHTAAVVGWLWPPRCPRCGERATCPREQYCLACWDSLRSLRPQDRRWPLADEPGSVEVVAAFAVDGLFLDILTTSKYRRVRPVGVRLAERAAERLADFLPDGLLVPVPLTRAKQRERGFNQSEDFARALARRSGRAVRTDLLVRRRGGRALAGRRKDERAAAVRRAFAVAGVHPAEGRPPVLLVDDVVTTGSTARACVAALRHAGLEVRLVVAVGRAFQAHADSARPVSELLDRL